MQTIVRLLVLFCVPLSAQQAVSRVPLSESKQAIRAFSSSGEVTLPVVDLHVDVRHASGKGEVGNLVVVHDPQNGHYLWLYRTIGRPGDTGSFLNELRSGTVALYVAPAEIVQFNMPGGLFIMRHSESAESLDAATLASIETIRRDLPVLEKSGFDPGFKETIVAPAIGMDFACPPLGDRAFSQGCGFKIKSIVSVSREGDNWRLVIRNRWDQEIILDPQFKLVSTKRLPEPKKE